MNCIDITDKVTPVEEKKEKLGVRFKRWCNDHADDIVIIGGGVCALACAAIIGATIEEMYLTEKHADDVDKAIVFGTNLAWARLYFEDPDMARAFNDKCGKTEEQFEKLAKFAEAVSERYQWKHGE